MRDSRGDFQKEFYEWNAALSELLKPHMKSSPIARIDKQLELLWEHFAYIRDVIDFLFTDLYNFGKGESPEQHVLNTSGWFKRAMEEAFRADLQISDVLGRWVHPTSTKFLVIYLKFILLCVRPDHDMVLPEFVNREIRKYMNGEEKWDVDRWVNGPDQFCLAERAPTTT